ncbi:PleD family two-component response regulator [Bradyrhizobium sp. S3.12.5]|uniref:hypothetical protein n=1 Tax=Bradyrhizobium sp. S3.12.5 TaxID=3156386 RepID=UPI003394FC26
MQDRAIAARTALVVGADKFDRLSVPSGPTKVGGDILNVYARDRDAAAEMEDEFTLYVSLLSAAATEWSKLKCCQRVKQESDSQSNPFPSARCERT